MKSISGEYLKLLFGLKLKQVRQDKKLSLKNISEKTHLSVSYLSEIESGKKYPKPEKLITLSQALEIPFDELVSMNVGKTLNPLMELLESPLIREFPFQMFGINIRNLIDLATNSPHKSGALVRTLSEFMRSYDMRVEHFLFAALRSYQKYHKNYFEDIEKEVVSFQKSCGLSSSPPISYDELKKVAKSLGCEIDIDSLSNYPELLSLRSVFVEGDPDKLLINPKLLPSQKAFIIGREIGYRVLKLKNRPKTSSWIKIESFDQILDNFKASYFSGALHISQKDLVKDLQKFFSQKTWKPDHLLEIMHKYQVTPEMFLYRLSQIIPKHFGIDEIYYLRFSTSDEPDRYHLTKELNMSPLGMPSGINLREHYCRRWLAISQLKDTGCGKSSHKPSEKKPNIPIIDAQRSRFIDQGLDIFNISTVRPLILNNQVFSSMTIGFVITDKFKKTVKFWNDSSILDAEVNETCERCCLKEEHCSERASESKIYAKKEKIKTREIHLNQLFDDFT